MHVQPISTFRLFQEGHLLRNSIAIFVLTTLFYFIGAELRLVHELSLFWPLNGVMAGVSSHLDEQPAGRRVNEVSQRRAHL